MIKLMWWPSDLYMAMLHIVKSYQEVGHKHTQMR